MKRYADDPRYGAIVIILAKPHDNAPAVVAARIVDALDELERGDERGADTGHYRAGVAARYEEP